MFTCFTGLWSISHKQLIRYRLLHAKLSSWHGWWAPEKVKISKCFKFNKQILAKWFGVISCLMMTVQQDLFHIGNARDVNIWWMGKGYYYTLFHRHNYSDVRKECFFLIATFYEYTDMDARDQKERRRAYNANRKLFFSNEHWKKAPSCQSF